MKQSKSSVGKNYIYNVIYQILAVIAPLITMPYVSRIFGPEYLGIYSYTNTIAQYYVLFAMLGLTNYGNRSIAAIRDNQKELDNTFSEIYSMQILTGLTCLLVYVVYILVTNIDYQIYNVILLFYVISALFDINWFFFGLEQFKLTVTRNIVIKVSSVVAIFAFVKTKEDLWFYILIHALSALFSTIALWPYAIKRVHYRKPKFSDVIKHFKPNIVLFIPVIAVSIYKYMDKIMLGNFSKTETGYYENAEKLLTLALGFITAFGTVMLPKMSNLVAHGGKEKIKDILINSMRFVMGLSFALAFGLAAIAPEFVVVFFGEEFEPCVQILYGLASTAIFVSWSNVIRTQFLIPLKYDRIYIYAEFFGATINLVLNLIFIPKFGAMGAVIGTIAAEFGVAFLQTFLIRRDIDTLKYIKLSLPFLFFGFIMYLVVRYIAGLMSRGIVEVACEVLIGVIVYLVLWAVYELLLRKIYKINVRGM